MERSEIVDILADWNFWRKEIETGVKREDILKKLDAFSKLKEIVVVKGIRRSGKSTSLLQFCKELMERGTKKEDILIVNFEDPRFKKLDLELMNKIYDVYLTSIAPSKKHYVILDEVQPIDGWEKFARYLHENKGVNVMVTGSSSKLLSSEYSTVLAGRHLDIEVKPLSFKEYLSFLKIEANTEVDIAAKRHSIQRAFYEYIEWGGFPKVVLAQSEEGKKELLNAYFQDIIIKDIVTRYKIKEIDKIQELAKYYLVNCSTLQSFNKVKNLLKISLDTVERFSYYLSYAYLVYFISKFSYSKKEQILNPKKTYCSDTGMRNFVSFNFSEDLGRLAENIVFNWLNKNNAEIYYWKGKYEADFIVKRGTKIEEAVQVCWSIKKDETKKRELNGLVEACTELKLKKGLILTEDFSGEEKIGKITIVYEPLWKWLLKNE